VGVLLPLQFLPRIRERFPRLHRVLGRMLFLLVTVGNIGTNFKSYPSSGGELMNASWLGGNEALLRRDSDSSIIVRDSRRY